MRQPTARPSRLALLGALGLALAGCGADTTDAVGEDTAAACEALAAYTEDVEDLVRVLGPDATVAEVQAARDQAAETQQALHESIADVTDDRTDDVARAWDSLVTAFDAVDSDTTLAEAAAGLQDEAQSVVDATASVAEDLDCS